MADVEVRSEGRAGRITLNRPKALNALTHEMCLVIERALDTWALDDDVSVVVLDGAGERAFCAGGDLAGMYRSGRVGDFDFGRQFWRDEYRMNCKIARYPKPVVALMHGFTMGGGVGLGCHGAPRVVCEDSRVSMPECGIGLVPDVGGSLLLARAPGRCGEYLALTAARVGPADAIFAGFADVFVPRADWDEVVSAVAETGSTAPIAAAARPAEEGRLALRKGEIDAHFGGASLDAIVSALAGSSEPFAAEALEALGRNSPLSMACAIELVHRAREFDTVEAALRNEYRFTSRAAEHGDFLEGIRATIIDKDRRPVWRHDDAASVRQDDVERMLAPLGREELNLEGR